MWVLTVAMCNAFSLRGCEIATIAHDAEQKKKKDTCNADIPQRFDLFVFKALVSDAAVDLLRLICAYID